jgi:hypothetical protein
MNEQGFSENAELPCTDRICSVPGSRICSLLNHSSKTFLGNENTDDATRQEAQEIMDSASEKLSAEQ